MAEGFFGETKVFAGNFAPRSWAFCYGQLLPIAQNQALFSILGTTYGGDGRTTFALPDCRGRVVLGEGSGPGLTSRRLGSRGGGETHTLSSNEMPTHSHTLENNAVTSTGNQNDPSGHVFATVEDDSGNPLNVYSDESSTARVGAANTGNAGGGSGFNIMQPWICMHWIICLTGIFPSRN